MPTSQHPEPMSIWFLIPFVAFPLDVYRRYTVNTKVSREMSRSRPTTTECAGLNDLITTEGKYGMISPCRVLRVLYTSLRTYWPPINNTTIFPWYLP